MIYNDINDIKNYEAVTTYDEYDKRPSYSAVGGPGVLMHTTAPGPRRPDFVRYGLGTFSEGNA